MVNMIHQILANGLCLLCCYKWDSDPEAAFPDDGEEDEGIAVSSESSNRSDEPIIALRNVEPLQVLQTLVSQVAKVNWLNVP